MIPSFNLIKFYLYVLVKMFLLTSLPKSLNIHHFCKLITICIKKNEMMRIVGKIYF